MKLAASNIAWPFARRLEAYRVLADHGLTGLEVAPALLLGDSADPFAPHERERTRALDELADFGLGLVSMQSLLFGVEGAALFGTADQRAALVAALRRAIALAARLGITHLVFGSPRQRVIPGDLGREEAWDQAAAVFRALGHEAQDHGAVIAMEPNPAAYGTNFLTTLDEAEAFVRQVDHPAIRLNLDLGAAAMNGEEDELAAFAARSAGLVSHVHVSAPNLAPAPDKAEDTAAVLGQLARAGYAGWHSIEMRCPEGLDPVRSLEGCARRLADAARLAEGKLYR